MIGKKINQLATELAPVSTDLTIIGDPISGVSKKITLAQLGAIFSGAVSFYTNLAGFPATGDINVIYCAKDTQKLYLWSGSAYVEVFPSQALLDTYQLRSEKGNANGYASLDSQGKVPISQLPSSIMEYKGTWNASTNTPTLANGTGDTGDVYICNVAGTVNFGAGPITFAVGDYVIYSGTIWQRSSGAVGTVTSVSATITGDAIGITGSPVTTSGTLAFAFAGTGAQYIKGDGTLATFPNTIAQATNLIAEVYNSTGATLTKGTVVYINGGQGNLPTVTKALASGDSTSAQTFGIVQADITNNNNGFVVVSGRLENIDTQAFSVGAAIYLSGTTAGAFTSTKPYAPTHLVYIGVIVRSHPTQGVIEVKIQNGYELDELHNVAAQTPSNNDGLFYESSTSLWKNKSIATILGYTPQEQLNGTGFVKASGTTITYDNSTYVTTDTNQTITGIKTFNNITNFNQNINGGIVKLSQGVLLSKAANIGTDPGHVTLLVQGITGTNYIYFADGDNFLNTQSFAIPTSGTYTYSLQAASGTLAFTSDLTGGTVTSVGLSSATSGVTIGSSPITTSGTITLAIATASGSQQGLLSSTDWTTFNNKQNALTNPVTGTGTTNYLPKFTGTSTIGNSLVFDNGTNVGIGTATPYSATNYKFLTIDGTNGSGYVTRVGSINSFLSYSNSAGTTLSEQRALPIVFETTGTSRMTLDASGNLGLGVTPSAWSTFKVIQVGSLSSLYSSPSTYLGHNIYYNSGNKYIANGYSLLYGLNDSGQFVWYNAPSGTAGNAISFTQAMTLNASGNLSIGNTNDTYKLDVTGTGRFTGNLLVSTTSTSISNTLQFVPTNTNGEIRGQFILQTVADTSVNTNDAYRWKVAAVGGAGNSGNWNSNLNFLRTTRGGVTDETIFTLNGYTGAATFSSSIDMGLNKVFSGGGYKMLYRNSTVNITYSGTSNWQINNDADNVALMTVLNGGNVGIGTTSPSALLHLSSGTPYIYLDDTSTSGTRNRFQMVMGDVGVVQTMNFGFNNTSGTSLLDVLTINENGRVGIGTTSPSQKLEVAGIIRGEAVNVYGSSDPASTSPYLFSPSLGALGFGANGSERMRITSGGDICIASTSPVSTRRELRIGGNAAGSRISLGLNGTNYSALVTDSGGNVYLANEYNDSAIKLLMINYNNGVYLSQSATSWTANSDERLKDINGTIDNAVDKLNTLRAVNFSWKSDSNKKEVLGLIAQDVAKVFPQVIDKNKIVNQNEAIKDNTEYLGVRYTELVPVLVKAIQELKQELDTLKNK